MRNLVILSGAGISAESGLKTFRDSDGLWEGYDINEVASINGFNKNPELVLDFYNLRRKQLLNVLPNKAHYMIKELEQKFFVHIITQNVDDLHERAGSTNVLHLHGELFKARSVENESLIYDWKEDINLETTNSLNHQLRPHIVWFGETVPKFETAKEIIKHADIVIIIGTSLQVYPAAGLIDYAPNNSKVFYIDPKPNTPSFPNKKINIIKNNATEGMKELLDNYLNNYI